MYGQRQVLDLELAGAAARLQRQASRHRLDRRRHPVEHRLQG
jgi:hypothetical protein